MLRDLPEDRQEIPQHVAKDCSFDLSMVALFYTQ